MCGRVDTSTRIIGMTEERSAETFVGFAGRWEPYGGADDEDIFVAFGISGAEYRRRLWWALNLPSGPDLDDDVRDRLREYAMRTTRLRRRRGGSEVRDALSGVWKWGDSYGDRDVNRLPTSEGDQREDQ